MEILKMIQEGWVTIKEAAELAGVSHMSIWYWIKHKGLESMPYEPDFGHKTTLVHVDDIREIMKKRERK